MRRAGGSSPRLAPPTGGRSRAEPKQLKTPAASARRQSVVDRQRPTEEPQDEEEEEKEEEQSETLKYFCSSESCCAVAAVVVVVVATSKTSSSSSMDTNRLSAMPLRQPTHLRLANDRRSPYGKPIRSFNSFIK